jgi:hypothetical protein
MGGSSMKHSDFLRIKHRLENLQFGQFLLAILIVLAFQMGIESAIGWTFGVWFFGQWFLNHCHQKDLGKALEREEDEAFL